MKLTLIPSGCPQVLAYAADGDTLIVNGDAIDLSSILIGGTLPRHAVTEDIPDATGRYPVVDWLCGDITNEGGDLCVPVLWPLPGEDPRLAAGPVTVTVASGPVTHPTPPPAPLPKVLIPWIDGVEEPLVLPEPTE